MASKKKKSAQPARTRGERERSARHSAPRAPVLPRAGSDAVDVNDSERMFVDVSVVRVQSYLSRTGDLRGFRGASALVSALTGHAEWESKIPTGARLNTEAGDIDGVVSVEIVTDDEPATIALRVAHQIVAELRDGLPAAYLSAVHGVGRNYVRAFAQMKHRRDTGDLLIDAPPPVAELVLAKPCDRCLSWPAVARISAHSNNPTVDGDAQGCVDCLARYIDGTKGHHRDWRPRAESTLLTALRATQPDTIRGFPDAYEFLAEGEHLALIYADGNKVGEFIDQSARLPRGLDTAILAPAIQDATVTAITEAIAGLWQPIPEVVPVLPHILGGDDVMITVRAEHAWPIVVHATNRFGQLMKATAAKLTKSGALPSLSMSAGIVFFHRKTPFVDVVEFAATQLVDAKTSVRGSLASVTFLDIAADGARRPPHRPVWPVRELIGWHDALSAVAALPAAHRATLLGLLREGRIAEARRRIDLQGSTIMVELAEDGLDLRDQLDLARWWPAS